MIYKQKGFAQIILVGVLVALVIFGGIYYYFNIFKKSPVTKVETVQNTQNTKTVTTPFPESASAIPAVKTSVDISTVNKALDSADLNKIDAELDAAMKDASNF